MPRPLAPLAALALAMFAAAPAAAQLVRYECRTAAITAESAPQRSARAARNAAEDAWVASARSQHRFAYRWALAQEVHATRTRSAGADGQLIGTASAYPCRVFVERPNQGTLTVNETESQRVCRSFPSLADAQRHNCTHFYPMRR